MTEGICKYNGTRYCKSNTGPECSAGREYGHGHLAGCYKSAQEREKLDLNRKPSVLETIGWHIVCPGISLRRFKEKLFPGRPPEENA